MTDMIEKAVRSTRKQSHEAFLVASHWSESDDSGVILINRQSEHDKYAVWTVNATGDRFTGFFSSDYSAVQADFNGRLMKLVDREIGADVAILTCHDCNKVLGVDEIFSQSGYDLCVDDFQAHFPIVFDGERYERHDLTLMIANGKDGAWQSYVSIRDQSDANFAAEVIERGHNGSAYASGFIPAHKWMMRGLR